MTYYNVGIRKFQIQKSRAIKKAGFRSCFDANFSCYSCINLNAKPHIKKAVIVICKLFYILPIITKNMKGKTCNHHKLY